MIGRLISTILLLLGWSYAAVADTAPVPVGRTNYLSIIKAESELAGLPWAVADAVMATESGYDPSRIGTVGEIGLMQVRPGTAALLGFTGSTADLMKPSVNIHFGVVYLAGAWQLARGDLCRTLMKYRAGHGQDAISPLSASYCLKARVHMTEVGTSVPGFVPISLPVTASHASSPRRRVASLNGTKLRGNAFWAAHDSKVALLRARVERKWRRVASR